MLYTLGPFVLEQAPDMGEYWRPPAGTVGLIDLRGDCTKVGFGFFATEKELGSDYLLLGTQLDDPVKSDLASKWASALGVDQLYGSTVLACLVELLGPRSDPEGGMRAKPILPTHLGVLELHLGGHSRVWHRRFEGVDDPCWPAIQKVRQDDYRRIRTQALVANSPDRTVHQRVLAVWQRQYGIPDVRAFIPGDLPVEAPVRPSTSIQDTFTDTNGARLNAHTPTPSGGFSWTEVAGTWTIQSNQATSSTNDDRAVAAIDLSSDDHWHQSDMGSITGSAYASFNTVRHDAAANSFYGVRYNSVSNIDDLYKRITGSFTALDTNAAVRGGNLTGQKVQVDGSSLRGWVQAEETLSATDTAITGVLRVGYRQGTMASGRIIDNFQAADLAVYVPHVSGRGAQGGRQVLSGGLAT